MSKIQKFYAVWKGRQVGIFKSWQDCSAQVSGFPGAQYKAFTTLQQAENALQASYEAYLKSNPLDYLQNPLEGAVAPPLAESLSVDAACSGNPGILEYQCVFTRNRKKIFKKGPFQNGTNNIGEFLAIVHALAYCQKKGLSWPIYSDSDLAIGWVNKKKCNTNLLPAESSQELFDLIQRAEAWLESNSYENQVLKWDTTAWGENPADFGRK